MTASRSESWLAGTLFGVLATVLLFLFPIAGLAMAALGLALVLLRGTWLAGLAGLLCGAGGTWCGLLLRAAWECEARNRLPGHSCESPSIEGYVAAGAVVLATGVALTLAAVARSRR